MLAGELAAEIFSELYVAAVGIDEDEPILLRSRRGRRRRRFRKALHDVGLERLEPDPHDVLAGQKFCVLAVADSRRIDVRS